jgi:hypothetical protein
MNELCVKMRLTPQSAVSFKDPATKFLYAGGAVQDAFYGTAYASDVDIFVPSAPNTNVLSLFTFDTDLYDIEKFSSQYPRYISGIKAVAKMVHRATRKPVLDIVFVHVPNQDISMEDFHQILVATFDMPICALAWDGYKLYYPPKALANLATKSSIVRPKSSSVPGRGDARIKKYLARGYKLFSENFDREFS